MRTALLLFLVLALVGCTSADAFRSDTKLVSMYDQDEAERPARFMGGFQDALLDHVGSCLAGWDFFWRSTSRNSMRDWERMKAFFR